MSVRNMNFAPSGNNDNNEGMPDVNSREYKINQYYEARREEAKAKVEANNTEKNVESNSAGSEKPKVVDYVDISIEKHRQITAKEKEAKRAESLEAQRLAREKYYKEQHDLRKGQAAHEGLVTESAERNENDRKIELRHQFNQIKVETDTYLKMQAGLGLMSEKEIRDYRDNLKKQEENALNYMRDGGEGGFVPMENLMKNSLDQLKVFESKVESTPEYQEMVQRKALAQKEIDAIKERRAAISDHGDIYFQYKEKMYKMEANLAERDFLAKAFSGEVNNTIDKAEETFRADEKAASNLTYRLKENGKKLSPEDYEKIDAVWSVSARAKEKLEELKKADKKEIALDFAKSQFNRTKFYEQKSGVEGSILHKFDTLTGEDTIEKFVPTVKDKMGEVAAKNTDIESVSENDKSDEKVEDDVKEDLKQTTESINHKKEDFDFGGISAEKIAEMEKTGGPVLLDADNQIWMQKLPKDQLEQLQKMLPKDQLEQLQKILEEQKNGNSKTEAIDSNSNKTEEPSEKSETKESDTEDADIENSEKEDSETEKKKGFVAGVIEKIKKHGEGIKRFALIAGIGALVALAAHGGNKFNTNNNTAVEKSMDNNGDTDGNVEEALAEHDAGSEVDSLIRGNSFNIMVDGNETKIELNDNINPEFPGFTDARRSGNDMTFVDRSGLESLKEQGASSEALGAEGMKEILNTMENPNMASYLGASFGAFEMADSPTAVNDITYMIQHGDAEAQVAIKEKANNTIANFLEGSTLKLGSIMNETYQSGYASNNGGEGNLQVDMALDKDGVFHKDQAVEFVYAENKDGENIMDMNVRDGFKENSLRALGVIEKNASDGEVMNIMSSVKILGINVKCGQVIFQYLKTEKKGVTKTVDKTEVTTSVVTPENVEVIENKEPEPSKPKNETPAPTPKENPKTPENNVSEGKTNTASTDGNQQKMGKVEADKAIYEFGDENHDATKQLPGSEIEDKAIFDQMVREAAKQDLTPNSYVTTQDNSQGVVHQEGVATEKQEDAKNRSVLPEEKPVERQDIQGSHSEDKSLTDVDIADAVRSANSDNKIAHESGQTTTVDATSNSEQ